MLAWFSANLINIVLVAAIVLLVALLVRGLIRDRKSGKPACGGSCGGCGGSCAGCAGCAGCAACAGKAAVKKV